MTKASDFGSVSPASDGAELGGVGSSGVLAVDPHGRRLATVDLGGPNDVFPGALVTWLHTPRGVGYTTPVDAVVLTHARRPRTWVRIEVTTLSGREVVRRVDVRNLRWRGGAK